MNEQRSFIRIPFYVSLAISSIGECMIHVDTNKPQGYIISPPHDRKYVIMYTFIFDAPRRGGVLATIITNLKCQGIYPGGKSDQFNPPINPDNKHYTGLSMLLLDSIKEIVKKSISGFCLNKDLEPEYTIAETSSIELNNAINSIAPQINLDNPSIVILDTSTKQGKYTLLKPHML